jgi:hypothetical protein
MSNKFIQNLIYTKSYNTCTRIKSWDDDLNVNEELIFSQNSSLPNECDQTIPDKENMA